MMPLRRLIKTLIGDVDDLALIRQIEIPRIVNSNSPRYYTERELLEKESKIGARIFGPLPNGGRREFFCLDETSWIWYEEWRDEKGQKQKTTVRYEVQDVGILKIQEGGRYSYLEGVELDNFVAAAKAYHNQVLGLMYRPILAKA